MASLTPARRGFDATWAADQLEHFFKLHDRWQHERLSNRPMTAGLEDAIWGAGEVLLLILAEITPDWSPPQVYEDEDPWGRWESLRVAGRRALPRLRRADELARKLGDGAPALSASGLHPWAWEGARSLWHSGHYRQGVVNALMKVQAETQNKTGRHDLSEIRLFQEVFRTSPPQA